MQTVLLMNFGKAIFVLLLRYYRTVQPTTRFRITSIPLMSLKYLITLPNPWRENIVSKLLEQLYRLAIPWCFLKHHVRQLCCCWSAGKLQLLLICTRGWNYVYWPEFPLKSFKFAKISCSTRMRLAIIWLTVQIYVHTLSVDWDTQKSIEIHRIYKESSKESWGLQDTTCEM